MEQRPTNASIDVAIKRVDLVAALLQEELIEVGISEDATLRECVSMVRVAQENLRNASVLYQRKTNAFRIQLTGRYGFLCPGTVHTLVVGFSNGLTYEGKFTLKKDEETFGSSVMIPVPFVNHPCVITHGATPMTEFVQLGQLFPCTRFVLSFAKGVVATSAFIVPGNRPGTKIEYMFPIVDELRFTGFIGVSSDQSSSLMSFDAICSRLASLTGNKKPLRAVAVLTDGSIVGSEITLVGTSANKSDLIVIDLTADYPSSTIFRHSVNKRRFNMLLAECGGLEECGIKNVQFSVAGDRLMKIMFLFRDGMKEHLVAKPTIPVRTLSIDAFSCICEKDGQVCVSTHTLASDIV